MTQHWRSTGSVGVLVVCRGRTVHTDVSDVYRQAAAAAAPDSEHGPEIVFYFWSISSYIQFWRKPRVGRSVFVTFAILVDGALAPRERRGVVCMLYEGRLAMP